MTFDVQVHEKFRPILIVKFFRAFKRGALPGLALFICK